MKEKKEIDSEKDDEDDDVRPPNTKLTQEGKKLRTTFRQYDIDTPYDEYEEEDDEEEEKDRYWKKYRSLTRTEDTKDKKPISPKKKGPIVSSFIFEKIPYIIVRSNETHILLFPKLHFQRR
jgi:hypothetical protein